MTKNIKFFAALLALVLFALSSAFAPPSAADASVGAARRRQVAPAQERRGLTPQEARGKAIYLRGESASGREITADLGDISVPASTVTCAGCHGPRGEGKTEGGVTAGGLAWAHLTKSDGHTHPTGRKHGPFDETSFKRSVTGGVDPAGNTMLVAMPRYRISSEELSNVIAYLKRIETESDPGLTETEIKVGTILPRQGQLSEMGAAMRDMLAAYFDDVNGRGGIYNRRVELRVAEVGADAAATSAAARRLAEREQLFAFVGGISAGADKELAALAGEMEIPFIGPSTLLPEHASPVNRQVFYLLPGLGEQARALVNFAASNPALRASRVVILHSDSGLAETTAAAIEDQARRRGLKPIFRERYPRSALDARQLVRKLKGENTDAFFFLGAGGEEAALIREASAAGWTPNFFLLGALTGEGLIEAVTPSLQDKVFVAFPTVPADITPAGLAEFRSLQAKHKFAARHTASQLAAFGAAKIFVEALRRAGRDLSRERLVTALEGFYDYETGVTPRITFGPNRRVGAAGANVLKVDAQKKEFAAAGGWVKSY